MWFSSEIWRDDRDRTACKYASWARGDKPPLLPCVGGVTFDKRLLEKADDRREHLLAGQTVALHVGRHAISQGRKRCRELHDVLVLVLVSELPPFRIGAVLLAPSRIEASRLYVSVGRGTDPDELVGRWDADRLDTPYDGFVVMRLPSCRSR
jgi:hypothetical protein